MPKFWQLTQYHRPNWRGRERDGWLGGMRNPGKTWIQVCRQISAQEERAGRRVAIRYDVLDSRDRLKEQLQDGIVGGKIAVFVEMDDDLHRAMQKILDEDEARPTNYFDIRNDLGGGK